MAFLNVISLNINGLNDPTKRQKVFSELAQNTYHFDIFLLQETHIVTDKITKLEDEWKIRSNGGESFWNAAPSPRECGVAVLIKNKNVAIQACQMDTTGRIICINIIFEKQCIQIFNIYAPTTPSLREFFYEKLQDFTFSSKHMILAGDFNMVEDPMLDRVPPGKASNYTDGNVALQSFVKSHNLSDAWRTLNTRVLEYSFDIFKDGKFLKS